MQCYIIGGLKSSFGYGVGIREFISVSKGLNEQQKLHTKAIANHSMAE